MKHRLFSRSLHQSIRWVVVICFAMIGICALLCLHVLSRAFSNELYGNQSELAERYFVQIDAFLDGAVNTSMQILSNSAIQNGLTVVNRPDGTTAGYAAARKGLQTFVTSASGEVSSFIRYIAVVDNGQRFYSYGGLLTNTSLQRQVRELLEVCPDNGSVKWSSVNYSGRQYIALTRAIRRIANTSLEPLGYVVIYIDVPAMLKRAELNGSGFMSGTELYMDGVRFYRGEGCPPETVGRVAPREDAWSVQRFAGKTCFVTSRVFSNKGMHLVNYRDYGAMFRTVNITRSWIVTIIICVIVVFLFASRLIIDRQFRKLNRLTELMKATQPGKYRIELDDDLKREENEVGVFARHFQQLMDQADDLINRDLRRRLFAAQAQYRMLRAQIHPHFLYNTLETIHALAVRDRNPQIARIAMSLSRLVRAAYSGDAYVPLQKEVEFVQEYLTIYRIRFGDRLQAVIDWDSGGAYVRVPQLILQPLVENAIRYGLMQKAEPGVIRLRIRYKRQAIRISLFDNGVGFPEALIEKYQAMDFDGELDMHGYTNVLCRLKNTYGDRATCRIHSRKGRWTNIGITIPDRIELEEAEHEADSAGG